MTTLLHPKTEPAAAFDRLEVLPQADRAAFVSIIMGKGGDLLRQHTEASKHAGTANGTARPIPELAKRHADGRYLLAALGLRPGEAGHAASGTEKPSLEVLRSPTARSLTIVFSGNNPDFALPPHLLVHQDTHLVLINDRRRCFALAGIPGLGADYDACLAGLRRIIDSLKPDAIFVLGLSAGGAGAIKFACDLPADRILCFSVPTTLRLADDPGAPMSRYPQLARLYRLDPGLGIDLASYYAAHATAPPATLVFGARHPRDAFLARRMEGIPGVTLVALDGYDGHGAYRWLAHQNAIGSYFDRLYAPSGEAAPGSPAAGSSLRT